MEASEAGTTGRAGQWTGGSIRSVRRRRAETSGGTKRTVNDRSPPPPPFRPPSSRTTAEDRDAARESKRVKTTATRSRTTCDYGAVVAAIPGRGGGGLPPRTAPPAARRFREAEGIERVDDDDDDESSSSSDAGVRFGTPSNAPVGVSNASFAADRGGGGGIGLPPPPPPPPPASKSRGAGRAPRLPAVAGRDGCDDDDDAGGGGGGGGGTRDRSSSPRRNVGRDVDADPDASPPRKALPSFFRRRVPPPWAAIVRTVRPCAFPLFLVGWSCRRSLVTGWDDPRQRSLPSSSRLATTDDSDRFGGGGGGGGGVGILDVLLATISSILGGTARRLPPASLLLVVNDVLGILLLRSLLSLLSSLRRFSFAEIKSDLIRRCYEFAKTHLSFVRRKLEEEEEKMKRHVEQSLKDPHRVRRRALPEIGLDGDAILEHLRTKSAQENSKWRNGLVSGTVYSGEDRHTKLLSDVYELYSLSNPLHSDIWPTVNKCEAEIVAMTSSLVDGGMKGIVGTCTSGGTESIILAVKSSKIYFGDRRGIKSGEIICGETAHAGLDKAADLLGLRLVKIPVDPVTFTLRPDDVERYVTSNTILIYGSAPSFPQGTIDPIEELSTIARRYGVGLHVDACLGGFVLPFAAEAGYKDVPKFDFGCEGVTSMSLDTHKYGYASKGTSVVLYRHNELRRAQYFSYAKWTGGLYVTPTIAGSRPGALLACAWASLVAIGRNGYVSRAKILLDATRSVARAVSDIPGLHLLPEGRTPLATVVCFTSDELDIYRVGDVMTKRGWSLNVLQSPPCLHLCLTMKTAGRTEEFVEELRGATERVREEETREAAMDDGIGGKKKKKKEGNAAIYGLAGTLPPGPVNELLCCYTDVLLDP